MAQTKLTIRELAQLAGVSPTAVSFVLNDRPGVSDETRRRIQAIIEQTNFKADRNSKRLSMHKSFNICLAYLDTSNPFDDLFYFEVAKGMVDSSDEYGYNLVLNTIAKTGEGLALPEIITTKDADGVIIFQDVDQQLVHAIESYSIPCIVLDSYANQEGVLRIGTDACAFSREAVEYLISKGHTRIAIICSSYISDYWRQVYDGFVSAMLDQKLMINPAWIQNTAADEASAYQCMEQILKHDPLPTAVFCVGDIYAISAMRCIKDHGMSIPGDISVMGADNIIPSRFCEPALTTVNLSKHDMGRRALEMLVRRINGEEVESISLSSCGIVERASVRGLS